MVSASQGSNGCGWRPPQGAAACIEIDFRWGRWAAFWGSPALHSRVRPAWHSTRCGENRLGPSGCTDALCHVVTVLEPCAGMANTAPERRPRIAPPYAAATDPSVPGVPHGANAD